MGNKSSNLNIKEILDNLSILKSNYREKVQKSFNSIPYIKIYDFNEIFNWTNEILKLIDEEIDNLQINKKKVKDYLNQKDSSESNRQGIQKEKNLLILNNKNPVNSSSLQSKKKVIIPRIQKGTNNQSSKLDYYTSKDIQDENKEITRIFQKESLNHINDDEEIENENIGQFLKEVALISRKAYNTSNELFIDMYEGFSEFKEEEITISNFENDEQLKKEFSSWVKEYEKTPEGNQYYKEYFNQFKGQGVFAKEKYSPILFSQLTILYFHSEISFPIVDVNFNDIKSGESFNHEKMIDFINKGNNRKVNFIILPSLFSNGNYLENGKSWVFTYKKNTFFFSDSKLYFENLVDRKEKFNKGQERPKQVLQNSSSSQANNPSSQDIESLEKEKSSSKDIQLLQKKTKNSKKW